MCASPFCVSWLTAVHKAAVCLL